jgi:hypothetical protein
LNRRAAIHAIAAASVIAMTAVGAQMTYAPPPPGMPWIFSPSAPDPNGPTPVCIRNVVKGPPDYNCYGGDAVAAIVRAQSRQFLEREAAKLDPAVVAPATKAPRGGAT